MLSDGDSERGLLSILLNNEKDIYIELSDIGITSNTFTLHDNKAIFESIKYCFETHDNIRLDVPMIISASKSVGYEFWFDDPGSIEVLEEIIALKANKVNGRTFGKKIRKLEVIRTIVDRLKESEDTLMDFTGDETIGEVFGVIEDKVLNMSSAIISDSESPVKVADVIDDYIQDKIDNPIEQVGISTGFPRLDEYWGGGLRNGSIYIIGARAKGGKSLTLNCIGQHISKIIQIPVLYLFLEMSDSDAINRMIAASTRIKARTIETGEFASDPMQLNKIRKEVESLKNANFYCKSIAGKNIDEQINIMRRWIIREVGLNNDGTAKPCVIMYDYLRLSDSSGTNKLQEYQLLGFMMESLSQFIIKYNVPLLAATQLNRSGFDKSDASTVSGSDRLSWLCSGLAILQSKTESELTIAGHGAEFGTKKLIVEMARYGPGIEPGNYINCFFNPSICSISEGITSFEAMKIYKEENKDESNDEDSDERILF